MALFFHQLPLAAIDPLRTLGVIWQSLGIFAYLFLFAIGVIIAFLVHGWLLLARHHCPLDLRHSIDPKQERDLRELVHQGMDSETINNRFFGGGTKPVGNLFFRYLERFAQRHGQGTPSPSLLQATEEHHEIALIQNISQTARFLAMVLPAVGLLGTLIGMFNAFFATNFTDGAELATTMQKLMNDFALALFTTMIAVVLKIAADLFNHFTLEIYIARLRGQLQRTRSLLLDLHAEGPQPIIESSSPSHQSEEPESPATSSDDEPVAEASQER